MHDVFEEMQLNGTRADHNLYLKAILGAASEYGGSRPWESQLIYDSMQRSGMKMDVRHPLTLSPESRSETLFSLLAFHTSCIFQAVEAIIQWILSEFVM